MSAGTSIQTINLNNVQPQKQTNFRSQSSPVKDYPPDIVEINSKKNTGISKNVKIGISAAAVLGLSTLVYVLSKGKVAPKQSLEQFKPAKTIEEARTFAEKTLNIQYSQESKANLDMINTVNEWLYKEKFAAKNNIPNVVHFTEKDIENPLGITSKMFHEGNAYNALEVNVNYINRFDDLIEYALKSTKANSLSKLICRNSNGVYEVVKPEYRCDNLNELVHKLNAYNKNSSFKDKMEIYDGFSEAMPYLNNLLAGKNVKMAGFSADGPFLHEMGHMLHQDTYKFYNEATKESSKICQDFQLPDKQKIAKQVSSYAANSPLEFVAETYKRLRRGQTFSDDVMALYKEYNGPIV